MHVLPVLQTTHSRPEPARHLAPVADRALAVHRSLVASVPDRVAPAQAVLPVTSKAESAKVEDVVLRPQ